MFLLKEAIEREFQFISHRCHVRGAATNEKRSFTDLSTRYSYDMHQYHSFILDLFTKNSLNSRRAPIDAYVSGVSDTNKGAATGYMSSRCAVISAVMDFKKYFAE